MGFEIRVLIVEKLKKRRRAAALQRLDAVVTSAFAECSNLLDLTANSDLARLYYFRIDPTEIEFFSDR